MEIVVVRRYAASKTILVLFMKLLVAGSGGCAIVIDHDSEAEEPGDDAFVRSPELFREGRYVRTLPPAR